LEAYNAAAAAGDIMGLITEATSVMQAGQIPELLSIVQLIRNEIHGSSAPFVLFYPFYQHWDWTTFLG
jgi:hypothetical protein